MSGVKNERKLSVNVYDYPEHLNPFSDEDNHSKLKFWTIGRKKGRSNSFSMAGLNDFRNTWNFKSFTKKGRRELREKNNSQTIYSNIPSESPIQYRKPIDETSSSTLPRERTPSTPQVNTYVYKGSVTPLPRFRFQERGSIGDNRLVDEVVIPRPRQRTTSTTSNPAPYLNELNESKVEMRGSRMSLQSQFDDGPNSSIRASARKKRRAPPPPPPLRISSISSIAPDITVTDPSDNTTKFTVTSIPLKSDVSDMVKEDIEEIHPFLHVELKIVEEDDVDHKETRSNIEDEPRIDCNEETRTNVERKLVLTESDSVSISDTTADIKQTPPDDNLTTTTSDTGTIELHISENNHHGSGRDHVNTEKAENVKEDNQHLQNLEDKAIIEIMEKQNSFNKYPKAQLSEVIKDKSEITVCSKRAAKMAEYERDMQYLTRSLSIQSHSDDVFSKVDVTAYKRRQSLPVTQADSSPIEKLPLKTNIEESSESIIISNTDDGSQSQPVKCIILNHENSKSFNARARNEFFDTIGKSDAVADITEETNSYKRPSVADMKLLFDTQQSNVSPVSLETSVNSPNPLPKPRRSKIFLNNSPSKESFKFESCPISPIPNKTFSDRL